MCQITDADEVAALVGQIREEKSESVTKAFGTLFGRVRRNFGADGEGDEDASAATVPATAEEERALRVVRERGDAAESEGADPSVTAAREELSDLMSKVRLMSRQFKGS